MILNINVKHMMWFTLYKNSPDHDRDEFAALKDNLCRIVQVTKGSVGKAHGPNG